MPVTQPVTDPQPKQGSSQDPAYEKGFQRGIELGRAIGQIEALLPQLERDLQKLNMKAPHLLNGEFLEHWKETKGEIDKNITEAKRSLKDENPDPLLVAHHVNDSMLHLRTWALILSEREQKKDSLPPSALPLNTLPNTFLPQNMPMVVVTDYPSLILFNDLYPHVRPYALEAMEHFFPKDGSGVRGFPPASEEQLERSRDWRDSMRRRLREEAPKWKDIK